MLSAHSLLIAAIFTVYMGLMAGLLAYICRSGRPREREEDRGDEGEPDLGDLPLAA